MSGRRPVALAARLARMREKVAERARADLARRDGEIGRVRASIEAMTVRQREVGLLLEPPAGRSLDVRDRTVGHWAAVYLERAIEEACRELQEMEKARLKARALVRRLAIEAERASTIHSTLDAEATQAAAQRQAKALDEMASLRAARKVQR